LSYDVGAKISIALLAHVENVDSSNVSFQKDGKKWIMGPIEGKIFL
jgi:hypothetical protein